MKNNKARLHIVFLIIIGSLLILNLIFYLPIIHGFTISYQYYKLKKDLYFIDYETKKIMILLKKDSIVYKTTLYDRENLEMDSKYNLIISFTNRFIDADYIDYSKKVKKTKIYYMIETNL